MFLFPADRLSFVFITSLPRGGTPYNGLYGEAPPNRGAFFRFLAYERVGISLVVLYDCGGNSVILVCKKAIKDKQMHFMAVKKLRKHLVFSII